MRDAEVKEIEKSENEITLTEKQNPEYFSRTQTSQFSTFFCRTIHFSDRNVDAVGRAELACLSFDGFGRSARFDRFCFADSGVFCSRRFGGAVADRYNRRKILMITQTSAMLSAFRPGDSDSDGNDSGLAFVRYRRLFRSGKRLRHSDAAGFCRRYGRQGRFAKRDCA